MAADVEIKFSKRKLDEVRKTLKSVPQGMNKVMSSAINATTREAKTSIGKKIRTVINAKAKDVNRRLVLKKATRTRWQAAIEISLKRLPLKTFSARQTKKGVSYKINKSGGRKKIDSAFVATMPSGHVGVFKRSNEQRLPIGERYGPSIGQVFDNEKGLAGQIKKVTNAKLVKNIESKIAWVLNKRGAA